MSVCHSTSLVLEDGALCYYGPQDAQWRVPLEAIRVLGTPSGIFARRKATRLSVLTEQQQRLQHELRDARMRRDTATAKREKAV
jgi:hypothetical protein